MILIDITALDGVEHLNLERNSVSMDDLKDLENRLSKAGYIITSISACGGGVCDTLVIKTSKKS